ncbi:YncE family protein [Oceanirhabdus sp. W0125-5]|uniref:YncE family protein n=1 Tax=Oceanirhabdus sp. W0125-5 TaxID=2999116 RepID=UPI0022F2D605|nr:YncE family protein [Oceanirhabdus sp. W0125-5]WBW99373.1 YncE family protein [Oceanirhabdus sp. W0125-5]
MDYLCTCNMASDDITVFDIESCKIVNNYKLCMSEERIGPHGICSIEKRIFTANRYNRGISIIDLNNDEKINLNIGVSCTDIAGFGEHLFILCGDSNNIIVYNNKNYEIESLIPCGNLPHSIWISKEKRIILTSNLFDDTLSLINLDDYNDVKKIKVGVYPMSVVATSDNEYVLVCESNIGMECKGSLSLVSMKNYKVINRVTVSKSPMDMYYDGNKCFVSNFADGIISVVDVEKWELVDEINVGGMPRGIIGDKNSLYICDSYNDSLIIVDIKNHTKKTIPIGKEPMRIAKIITL